MALIEKYSDPINLYRYRSLTGEKFEREVDALKNGSIWCSDFKSMNDAMEGFFSTSKSSNVPKDHDSRIEEVVIQKSYWKFCCFSENHENETMWAHYASQFSGFCIKYKLSAMKKYLSDDCEIVRISYSSKEPKFFSQTSASDEKWAKRILSFKKDTWGHEKEWRIFTRHSQVKFSTEKLKICTPTIYLGSKIQKEHEKKLTEVCRELNVFVYKMIIDGYQIKWKSLKLS